MKTSPYLRGDRASLVSYVEPLEARIAPAAISFVYTDLDGDLVKITASKLGTVAPPLDAGDLSFVGGGSSGQLATLNLTEAGFDGASVVFTVAKKPGSDGLAHVGIHQCQRGRSRPSGGPGRPWQDRRRQLHDGR